MNHTSEHKTDWSLRLLGSLQAMAEQNTNAVLMVLANVDHLHAERRYPESGLLFASKRWRAFYHCHETAKHPEEHGHFHLFTDIGNQTWSHVAGLSIDTHGQPLQWFAVNRWVTDGPWLEREDFLGQLKYITRNDEHDDLVGRWLGALLQLYGETLSHLLMTREQQLTLELKGRNRAETLEDRELYMLATQAIDLQSELEKHLLNCRTSTSQQIINKEHG